MADQPKTTVATSRLSEAKETAGRKAAPSDHPNYASIHHPPHKDSASCPHRAECSPPTSPNVMTVLLSGHCNSIKNKTVLAHAEIVNHFYFVPLPARGTNQQILLKVMTFTLGQHVFFLFLITKLP